MINSQITKTSILGHVGKMKAGLCALALLAVVLLCVDAADEYYTTLGIKREATDAQVRRNCQ